MRTVLTGEEPAERSEYLDRTGPKIFPHPLRRDLLPLTLGLEIGYLFDIGEPLFLGSCSDKPFRRFEIDERVLVMLFFERLQVELSFWHHFLPF